MTHPLVTCAAIAAMLLTVLPRPAAAAAHTPWIGFCSPVRGALPAWPRTPDRDGPDACHAVCTRSSRCDGSEDGRD
ncbi:hypothetical protein [Sphingomonas elodea]|uniref:hypothetical protein n=1 Tax=Sphingomonas elodea TaxID=179878 RepID=UPI0002631018|nr:hypothetical protein [Sphingomonas elodea]